MRAVPSVLLLAGLVALPHIVRAQTQPPAPPHPVVTEAVAAQFLAMVDSAQAAPQARAAWQRRLDTTHDTLESVFRWNNEHGQSGSSLRMLNALRRFWSAPALVAAYERAFATPSGKADTVRARAYNSAAAVAFQVPDQVRTRRWARESINAWRKLGDPSGMGRAYQRLVQAALRDGDHASLRVLADTGQMLCDRAHDDNCLAYFLNMRGESARVLQAYDSAVMYYDRSDAIYRRLSPAFRLDIAHNIGFTLLALGRSSEARGRFAEGMQHAVANADPFYVASFFAALASCDAADGKAMSAAKLFGLYEARLELTGRISDPADVVEYERYRSRARDQLGGTAFADAVRVGRTLPMDSVLATIR